MKKINLILILIFVLTLLACEKPNHEEEKEDNNNYVIDDKFIPNGKTTVNITNIESGSATLSFNNLEKVSYYLLEVSLSSDFNKNDTVEIEALTNPYKLYFDDNSKLYLKVTAISENGRSYEKSGVKVIDGKYAVYYDGDNFGSEYPVNWHVENGKITTDFHSLMATPSNDKPLKIAKEFKIDFELVKYFQIRFLNKNTNSKIKVLLTIENEEYEVITFNQIPRGYIRYDLSKLNRSGNHDVLVTILSTGLNVGFQLDYIKFINEENHKVINKFFDLPFENLYNEVSLIENVLKINNDLIPSTITTPQSEINFDPKELPILEIEFSNFVPRDTFEVAIFNSDDVELFNSGKLYIQNVNAKYAVNLLDLNINEKDTYTIRYLISSKKVIVDKMQLIGESSISVDVKKEGWSSSVSAFIDNDNYIRLNSTTIYNYGEVRKKVTIDLGETPIVFFDIESLSGSWAVKVIPEGAASDIYVIRDTKSTDKVSADLSQILGSQGITTFTFEIFIIGNSAADQSAKLKLKPIVFGNALNIISNTSDEVISKLTYNFGDVNIDDLGYMFIDINKISLNGQWKLYVIDNDTNRRYEMKTYLETKYPQRYNRSKTGKYIYDIKQITNLSGINNFSILIEVIGNGAYIEINNIDFTSNNNIPTRNNSSY